MKLCSRCKEQKSLDTFSRNAAHKDGYNNQCKTCVKDYKKTNQNKVSSYQKKYNRIYQIKNKGKINALISKRRAIKLKATPMWLTEEHFKEIERFYVQAQDLKLLTGLEYHVDHIVPLQGKNVCGLHVPWNLQVIPAKENMRKSNRLEKETNED